ncbi:MAG TPA: FtsX-like permease family protein [Pyrinomonadaceae bacterium]|nr:FtsX-like permease family protein [Pyrinomonadaceae bacterium]
MRISTIAWANLRRRKARALFLVAGIAIGIATAVALLSLSRMISEEIGLQLDQYGANIVVVPKSDQLALDYGGVAVSGVSFDVGQLTDEDVGRIREIPYSARLSAVAPKVLGAVEAEGRRVLLAGVDFESEFALNRWWRLVGRKPEAEGELVAGYDAARALGLIAPSDADESFPVVREFAASVDHTAMSAHAHHAMMERHFRLARASVTVGGREFKLAAVLAPTGGREDSMLFGRLGEAQALLKRPGQVSVVEVSALCKDCPVEDIVGQIAQKLPNAKVSALQQAVRARTETVGRLTRFAYAVSAVVLLIGALLIFTTVTGSVVERTKEIGVMRAVGFRRSHIFRGLMLEVLAVSALGGLLGWAAGALAARLMLPYFSQTGIGFDADPRLAALSVLAALAVGAAASWYPTRRASRLDPAEAVRHV